MCSCPVVPGHLQADTVWVWRSKDLPTAAQTQASRGSSHEHLHFRGCQHPFLLLLRAPCFPQGTSFTLSPSGKDRETHPWAEKGEFITQPGQPEPPRPAAMLTEPRIGSVTHLAQPKPSLGLLLEPPGWKLAFPLGLLG